ncbi:N-acetylmuramoyl-L-alanine amidase family protein [Falsiroseomonas tokyonensis]|uniref:N-acetylmuramoyl-L-alanine amidase n=1 Tax=Falsiroseomonas tokyonensis TaxID=430521 RepID=A0ABV7C3L3_9PROT|nr:N-acetylmuramoyl-L-alanine amidase [Falsiroseomonas tokyonensis]MBU8541215.1 N-acetylmuramoyl-L-alanine amidase [Falsiroseomonas tokyonensis]
MLGRRALASLLLGLAALPAPREALAAVTGATLEATGPGARLTLRLPAGASWRLRAARSPNRLLLEVPGQAWRAATRLRGAGPVRAARLERGRLRLDLSGPVALRRAEASDGQLVIEVVPGAAAPFARLAAGSGTMAEGGGTTRRTASLPLVVLDPGHGGRDPGAIGTSGTQEKRVVLAAALQLKRVLEAGGHCRVALTRSNDRFVPLGDRVEFARRRQAALFVSLHADSAPGARGASVYTLGESSDSLAGALARRENLADRAGGLRLPSVPPEVQAILMSLVRAETRIGSARMAQQVVAELSEDVPMLNNAHRQAGFVVLKAPDVPAVLVEMGFLSDPRDEAALRRADHRAKLARALGRAIHVWLAQGRDVATAFG